jgi:hypothetical protein
MPLDTTAVGIELSSARLINSVPVWQLRDQRPWPLPGRLCVPATHRTASRSLPECLYVSLEPPPQGGPTSRSQLRGRPAPPSMRCAYDFLVVMRPSSDRSVLRRWPRQHNRFPRVCCTGPVPLRCRHHGRNASVDGRGIGNAQNANTVEQLKPVDQTHAQRYGQVAQ